MKMAIGTLRLISWWKVFITTMLFSFRKILLNLYSLLLHLLYVPIMSMDKRKIQRTATVSYLDEHNVGFFFFTLCLRGVLSCIGFVQCYMCLLIFLSLFSVNDDWITASTVFHGLICVKLMLTYFR